MKLDREHKAQKMGEHIPGFAGYHAVHHFETDLLLRRYLASKLGEVRDRLADFIATGSHPQELREKLACSLKAIALLMAEVSTTGAEVTAGTGLSPVDEERLLDFDLVLLDKVAALRSQLDLLEAASGQEAIAAALELLAAGLAEVDEIFQARRRLF